MNSYHNVVKDILKQARTAKLVMDTAKNQLELILEDKGWDEKDIDSNALSRREGLKGSGSKHRIVNDSIISIYVAIKQSKERKKLCANSSRLATLYLETKSLG